MVCQLQLLCQSNLELKGGKNSVHGTWEVHLTFVFGSTICLIFVTILLHHREQETYFAVISYSLKSIVSGLKSVNGVKWSRKFINKHR